MDTFVIVLIFILVLIFMIEKLFFKESFDNAKDSLKLYVFVSGHCPHCHTYQDKYHADICSLMKSKGFDVQKVQLDGSEESSDLFNKFNVQSVPTGILVKEDKIYKRLDSNITPESVKQALGDLI